MFYIKRTFFFLILVLFYQNLSIANDKIAYIDLDYIINKSNAGNKLLKELDNLNKSNLKKLSLIKKEIDKNKDEIIKVKNVISEKEFKNKIEEQKKSIREFDKTKKKLENEINELRRKKMIEIVKKINPILEKYMEENSIEVLLKKESIYLSKNNYDITKQILDLVNKKIK